METCSVQCARCCHSRSQHPPRLSTSVLTHLGSCHCSCFLSTFSATPRLLQTSLDICMSSSFLGMHMLRHRTSSAHSFPDTASRHRRALEQLLGICVYLCISSRRRRCVGQVPMILWVMSCVSEAEFSGLSSDGNSSTACYSMWNRKPGCCVQSNTKV